MRRVRPGAAVCAAMALLAVPAAARGTVRTEQASGAGRAVVHTEQASAGPVEATLRWTQRGERYRSLRLSVVRAGAPAYDAAVRITGCTAPWCRPGGLGSSSALRAVDLDADGEPEVLVDVFTGGAHCCSATQVLWWTGAAYQAVRHQWGDPGYRLADVDGDGRPELVSADDRFAYRFTAYAGSAMPVQIWHVDHGRFVDVTASYPALVRDDAAHWLRTWRRLGPSGLGVLAAWAADEYRLGHGSAVRRELRSALRHGRLRGISGWPRNRAYIRDLLGFLKRTGYRG
jgi:hypothetical protein